MRIWLALLLFLICWPAQAAEFDYSNFKRLPVLEDGRLKPLDSFAHNMLQRLSGQSRDAPKWLAQALFDPAKAVEAKCLRVANPHIRAAFGLQPATGKLYSLTELAPGLSKTADEAETLNQRALETLTPDERDLLDLHTNVLLYNQLLQAMAPVLPLPFLYDGATTYLEAQKRAQELVDKLESSITPEQRQNPELMEPEQQNLAYYLMTLDRLRSLGQNNKTLRIIPGGWSAEWYAPWQILLAGQGSPQNRIYLQQWQELAMAYRANDASAWLRVSADLHNALGNNRLDMEVAYRSLRPYDMAALLLVGAAVLAGLGVKRTRLRAYAWGLITAASAVIIAALGARIYMLERPPVGTLYESMLFVVAIVSLGVLALTRKHDQPALLLGGAVSSVLMLLIAPAIKPDAESMTTLTAVLNTNFWLTVHVLCITAGYGACILTALLAHVMLALDGTRYDLRERLPLLHKVSLWALLLTAVGTLLGGVWADQSWGRFWGWDPKENGALIIVLWLVWVQHARLANQFSARTYTAGMALLGIVVAQAWFGVNLLSTGLHSYGFIEGIALGLFSFTAVELLIIAVLYVVAQRRGKHAA